MSAMSNSAPHRADVRGIPGGMRFWVVAALVIVAVAACACVFSGHVADAAGQAQLVGP